MVKFIEAFILATSLLIMFVFIGNVRYQYHISDRLRRTLHSTPIAVRSSVLILLLLAVIYGSISVHYINDDAIFMSLIEYITKGMGIAILSNIALCLFASEETYQDRKKHKYSINFIVIGFVILVITCTMTVCIDSESLRLKFRKHHEMMLNE